MSGVAKERNKWSYSCETLFAWCLTIFLMKKIVFIMSIGLFSLASEAQVISISEGSQISFRKSPDFDDTAIVGSRYL